ncbi:SGNH/GDSL hydrolase family protein [Nocardioides caldifontis]|uniref:SGNH/GDSL hydrolase family protein n=1 Tax=Nocardioides caldifontis TaxID=2588938 RepID=UPI0011DF87F4|nr:SGNH/GDSL hydrolase family protein [Nocardioides caldifontis]
MPADRPRGLGRAAVALAALLVVTGCDVASGSGSSDDPGSTTAPSGSPSESPPPFASYVALGDSFTAAPLVPDTDLAEGCFRSSANYPALVAAELGLELRDVSCSGADTGDVTGPQVVAGGRGEVPPQLRAVRPSTDLVTVGIGGNDQDVFASLVGGCARTSGGELSCREALEERYGDPRAVLEETGRRVADVVRRIRDKAPGATVVVVGYPRLTSTEEGCDLLPLTDSDRAMVAELEVELDDALREAAEVAGAEFLDMRERSEGHEICSDDPWVNGIETDQTRALAFHPFAEGQAAVAEALVEKLEELG